MQDVYTDAHGSIVGKNQQLEMAQCHQQVNGERNCGVHAADHHSAITGKEPDELDPLA